VDPSSSPSGPASDPVEPSLPARVALRFAVIYTILYVLPFPFDALPGIDRAAAAYVKTRTDVAVWFGLEVLGVPKFPVGRGPSGDTTVAYIWLLLSLVIAAIAAGIWSVARPRAAHHAWTLAWLRVGVRYVLAANMLAYGWVKVLKSQFPFPSPSALLVSYGESSPMGLLWRFMGYSTVYSTFVGVCEVVGGALLFFRRTSLLGALLLAGLLFNVVLLNFCFDVPVKIGSVHLLGMSLFLIAPHARRLSVFLVANRATPPADLGAPPGFGSARGRALRVGAKLVFIVACFGLSIQQSWIAYRTWGDGRPPPPLYGVYESAKSADAALAWRRVSVDDEGFVVFRSDGSLQRWEMQYEAATHTLRLSDKNGGALATEAGGAPPHAEALTLTGTVGGARATLALRRVKPSELLLVSRGFRWIQERPFHR
jgi:hypothetical protein